MDNKRMDSAVYAERRQVIECVYRAKNLLRSEGISLPRVDIRIVEPTQGEIALGLARMGKNVIWIPSATLVEYSGRLYQIVLHELLHAVWSVGHYSNCKLMHPNLQNITEDVAESIFIRYARQCSK